MKAVNKKELLHKLEEQTEKYLNDAIQIFQNQNEEALLKPAENGGWSIAQCLEHLNSYSRYYLPRIEKAISVNNKSVDDFYKSSWLGTYFIGMMNPGKNKKYKAAAAHQPASIVDAHAVVAEFIKHQEQLLLLLRKSSACDWKAIRINISIMKLIRLRLGDVFQFVIVHNNRHILQAKRVFDQTSL